PRELPDTARRPRPVRGLRDRGREHPRLRRHRPHVKQGEILGVAGESASGKSTLLNALGRLQRMPAATSAGEIHFHPTDGGEPVDLAALSEEDLAPYRWTKISVVMQSAMASLNPVIRLGEQFVDVIRTHDPQISAQQAQEQAADLLTM